MRHSKKLYRLLFGILSALLVAVQVSADEWNWPVEELEYLSAEQSTPNNSQNFGAYHFSRALYLNIFSKLEEIDPKPNNPAYLNEYCDVLTGEFEAAEEDLALVAGAVMGRVYNGSRWTLNSSDIPAVFSPISNIWDSVEEGDHPALKALGSMVKHYAEAKSIFSFAVDSCDLLKRDGYLFESSRLEISGNQFGAVSEILQAPEQLSKFRTFAQNWISQLPTAEYLEMGIPAGIYHFSDAERLEDQTDSDQNYLGLPQRVDPNRAVYEYVCDRPDSGHEFECRNVEPLGAEKLLVQLLESTPTIGLYANDEFLSRVLAQYSALYGTAPKTLSFKNLAINIDLTESGIVIPSIEIHGVVSGSIFFLPSNFNEIEVSRSIVHDLNSERFDVDENKASPMNFSVTETQMGFLNSDNLKASTVYIRGVTGIQQYLIKKLSDFDPHSFGDPTQDQSLCAGEDAQTGQQLGARLSIENAHFEWFTMRDSSICSLDLEGSKTEYDVEISNTRVGQAVYLSSAKARGFDLEKITGVRPERTEEDDSSFPILNMYDADVEEEISLSDITGFHDIRLRKTTSSVIRINRGHISGTMNLWGAKASQLFLDNFNIDETLSFWYANIDAIQLGGEDGEIAKIARIEAPHLRSQLQLNLGDLETEFLDFSNAQTGHLRFTCVKVSGPVYMTDVRNDEVVWLDRVNAKGAYFGGLHSPKLYTHYKPQTSTGAEDMDSANEKGDQQEESDAESNTRSVSKSAEHCANLENRFGVLHLEESQIEIAQINVEISHQLILNRAKIGSLTMVHALSKISENAYLNFRQATIGSILLPKDYFGKNGAGKRPFLDVTGADIGFFQIASAQDESSTGMRDGALIPVNLEEIIKQNSRDAKLYDAFLFDSLLPALRQSPEFYSTAEYNAETYAIVRNSLQRLGLFDLSRKIAIEQNDHYRAATNERATKVIYGLGRALTRYGYETYRAVFYLLGLWLAGFAVLLLDQILMLRKQDGKLHRPKLWEALNKCVFYSLDRTVPTLVLDEVFNSPATSGDRPYRARTQTSAWVISVLYIQRMLAFLVIAFAIGGLFNVYQ
ncbi:hypothetical protein HCZ23_05855 [Celeribacter sp. HF31]|uniref:hypothetical protein n=1 Tax=Celeribacter sp. HF31 TaxID=2721558 RepID=UPI0014300CC3|nr:hypothetical protein [Celeribacter sp. HF31]NIY78990.1 hypothetical protein [Celeribacter sp. HF31]